MKITNDCEITCIFLQTKDVVVQERASWLTITLWAWQTREDGKFAAPSPLIVNRGPPRDYFLSQCQGTIINVSKLIFKR